jgi:sugar diacid utilization regulator/predicted hydrocarbon binding protein
MRPTMPIINGMVLEMKNEISQITHNRSIIVDTHAFGSFRKDLIHNIGLERAKGFLFRYGWNLGRHDAQDCKEMGQYETIEELIEYGPILHSMKGYVKSITTKLEITKANGIESLHMESIWKDSYEAAEHLDKIGISASPVCLTLAGYASGFVSEVFGQKVIFKEISCIATGGSECYAIGKSEHLWGNEINDELYYLDETPIVEELELTYEKLLSERDHLLIANNINKILTNEVVNGANLERIIEEAYRLTAIPTAVHTSNAQTITAAGFSAFNSELTPQTIGQYINQEQMKKIPVQGLQTIHCNEKPCLLLVSPIILQNQLNGYCSFVFTNEGEDKEHYAQMMMDKITSICALSLFYEKTKLDSFEQMKSNFFKEILNGQFTSNGEIIAKASLLHLDLSIPYYIVVIDYRHEFKDWQKEMEFRQELFSAILTYSSNQKRNYLVHQKEKNICLLVTEDTAEKSIPSFIEGLYAELKNQFHTCDLFLGVSKRTLFIQEVFNAYKNAVSALRMAYKGKRIVYFDSLGVVGALMNEYNENEVREMACSFLENIQVNGQKDVDLIKTLYSFLLNGGNLEKTADDLSLSISGLRYRIHKLEDLLHKDLRNPLECYQLLMSIQALIILGDLDLKANVI